MSLLIPQEFIKDISQRSGYLVNGTKFANKNLKGLFMTPENVEYLGIELYKLIVNPKFVAYVLSKPENVKVTNSAHTVNSVFHDSEDYVYSQARMKESIASQALKLTKIFNGRQKFIMELIPDLINSNPKDFWLNDFFSEDYGVNNPVQRLSTLNKRFLETNATGFILQPSQLDEHYNHRNPDTGKIEYTEYDYGAASYSDGTWHPEHLFTENARNRANPYWRPRDIMFDTNPPKPLRKGFNPYDENRIIKKEGYDKLETDGLHHYDGIDDIDFIAKNGSEHFSQPAEPTESSQLSMFPLLDKLSIDPYLDDYSYGPGPGAGNKYKFNSYGDNGLSGGGTFPRWQYSMNDRPYERNIDDGLREGGISDRRENSARRTGYDMSALISKSTY